MGFIQKNKPLIFEVLRFCVVGGISFLFDLAVLNLIVELAFRGADTTVSIAVSNTAGFLVGVTVNYLLSVLFVFKSAKEGAGKDKKSALIFLVCAAIGLLLNWAIMELGVIRLGINRSVMKVAATMIVMVWNYLSRKVLIFKK